MSSAPDPHRRTNGGEVISRSHSPVDEDYPGDGTVPQPLPEEVHERYRRRLQGQVESTGCVCELEDDERVSSSVTENPGDAGDNFADIDSTRDGGSRGTDGDDDDDDDDASGDTTARGTDSSSPRGSDPTPGGSSSAPGAAATPSSSPMTRTESAAASPRPVDTVGLVNEGCTCYLNSLLQLLFHLSYLRSAVYRIPAGEGGDDEGALAVYKALQELFFQMQERTTAARTKKLTDAFGWGEQELFVQHDIQEMATLLRDNLEERMKGTVAEGAISLLFEGRGEQFVETLDKTYTSRSKDIFYDIHIPLGGFTNLLDSLVSLTQRDQLVGDNKYRVEADGKPAEYKDAEKGYQYIKFPPVTWFHLKRFAMDLTSPNLEMKKVNTRMEFPLVLDLRELERGEPTDGSRGGAAQPPKKGSAVEAFSTHSPAIYDLQGVIVHRGTVRSGHYYCYIRDWDPATRSFTRWIEFEDENVRVVPEEVAVNANYGVAAGRTGYNSREGLLSNANAYILSYVRRADAPVVLAPSPTDIITQRVKNAMRREMEEEERRARREREQRLCVMVYVVTDESLAAYCEQAQSELFPKDGRSARNFAACVVEVRKTDTIACLYDSIAAEPALARRGVTRDNCRLWRWTNNRSYRPTLPLPTAEECHRKPTHVRSHLSDSERDKPVSLCVYVQESLPFLNACVADGPAAPLCLLPPAADIVPLIKQLYYDPARGTYRVQLKAPTVVHGITLTLDAPYVSSCKVQYIISTGDEELPLQTLRSSVTDCIAIVPIHADAPATKILLQCSSDTGILPVLDAHLHVLPINFPPPSAALQARHGPGSEALSRIGHGRLLLFLKWFDPFSSTVRYVGSVLVDQAATLGTLATLWHLHMGLPVPPSPPPVGAGAVTASAFAYFEEGKGVIGRELAADAYLHDTGLGMGAVVVAQPLFTDTVLTHTHVEAYYATTLATVDLRVLEVVSRVKDNDEVFRQTQAEHRKLAAQIAEEAAAVSPKSAASSAVSPPPALVTPKTPSLPPRSGAAAGSPSVPTVEANPALDPFNTRLPVLRQPAREVVGNGVARMPSFWLYESACDAIAAAVDADPSYMWLYRSVSASDPFPEEHPVRNADDVTVEDLVTLDSYTVSTVVFFERLSVPRSLLELNTTLTVTLRDRAGHALHCEAFSLSPQKTLHDLLRRVCAAAQARSSGTPSGDPWGTLEKTLTASHFLLLAVDPRRKLIRHMEEVRATPGIASASTSSTLDGQLAHPQQRQAVTPSSLAPYEIVLMPAAPLLPEEQRVACCHGDYRLNDVHIFGHPFVITINPETTVRGAMRHMTATTRVPPEALNAMAETGKNYGVMMYTDQPLHFSDWDELVWRYWRHTVNKSGYIPNLLLNHPRPKERPGSRYIAQPNPKLRIAKN